MADVRRQAATTVNAELAIVNEITEVASTRIPLPSFG
jgi:hypothetical protein